MLHSRPPTAPSTVFLGLTALSCSSRSSKREQSMRMAGQVAAFGGWRCLLVRLLPQFGSRERKKPHIAAAAAS